MSNCLQQAFHKNALIAYFTLGYPSVAFTWEACKSLIDAGVDIIEIGLPFSDPIADGPIIQMAHQHALSNGEDVSIDAAFELLDTIKTYAPHVAVVFMGSTNLFLQYGYEQFFEQAKQRKCDGIIMPDSTVEMSLPLQTLSKQTDVAIIQLVSPLCSAERLEAIADVASGFIYVISSTGVTGERQQFADNLKPLVTKIKSKTSVPVAIGFGVSNATHCTDLCAFADGVIVGSHFTSLCQQHLPDESLVLKNLHARAVAFKTACVNAV